MELFLNDRLPDKTVIRPSVKHVRSQNYLGSLQVYFMAGMCHSSAPRKKNFSQLTFKVLLFWLTWEALMSTIT